jgi:spermidine/putrescine-binding protein
VDEVTEDDLKNMSTELLESFCKQNGVDISGCTTREQIIATMLAALRQAYDVDTWDTAKLKDFCELNEIDTAGITTDDGLRNAIIAKGLAVPVEADGQAAPADGQGE